MSIGPAGGSLPSADGRLTVIVPPGAVSSNITFSVQPITNQAPGGLGDGYQLGPDGQTFATPVQLAFHYTDDDLAGTVPDVMGVAYQDAQGYWHAIQAGTFDQATKTLTVPTSHFTGFAPFLGFQLKPGRASIIAGSSITLSAVDCASVSANDPRLVRCTAGNFSVNSWAVNGRAGGDNTTGRVSGQSLSGTYTAPAQPPPSNPVAVTADVSAGLRTGGRSTLQVVSNITVLEDVWTGTTASVDDIKNVAGLITWVHESTDGKVAVYRATGGLAVTSTVAGCTINPSTHALTPAADGILVVDNTTSPATYYASGLSAWTAAYTCDGVAAPPTYFAAQYLGGNGGPDGIRAAGVVTMVSGRPTLAGTSSFSGTDFEWTFRAGR